MVAEAGSLTVAAEQKAAHGELLNIEIRVSSDHSMTLAEHLQRGMLDIAFLRREQKPDLEYK
jgi:hypothetical protein